MNTSSNILGGLVLLTYALIAIEPNKWWFGMNKWVFLAGVIPAVFGFIKTMPDLKNQTTLTNVLLVACACWAPSVYMYLKTKHNVYKVLTVASLVVVSLVSMVLYWGNRNNYFLLFVLHVTFIDAIYWNYQFIKNG